MAYGIEFRRGLTQPPVTHDVYPPISPDIRQTLRLYPD